MCPDDKLNLNLITSMITKCEEKKKHEFWANKIVLCDNHAIQNGECVCIISTFKRVHMSTCSHDEKEK